MSGFEGNMSQLDALADWQTHTQWEGRYEPRRAQQAGEPLTSYIRRQRDGRYRVRWVDKAGAHHRMNAYTTYEEAKSAALVLERECGYRFIP